MRKKRTSKHKVVERQKGSFLLELLVAFAIISVAMTVVVDAYVTSQHSRQSLDKQTDLIKALNMVFEDMTREVRVSTDFACGSNLSPCTTNNKFYMTHIKDLNEQQDNEKVEYTLSGTKLQKKTTGPALDMTPPGIEVTAFEVEMVGSVADGDQVRTLVILTARDKLDPNTTLTLQTSFTERKY